MTDLLTQNTLDPATIDIRQHNNALILVANHRETPIAQVVRCFPFSTPDQWISLRNAEGDEIGLLETLEGLNDSARTLLETRLQERYHIPVIQSIDRVEMGAGGAIWHVNTEDGPLTFILRGDRGLDISVFPKIYFTDAHTRRRFVIPDFTALDRTDQKLARTHLPISFRGGRGSRGSRGRF